MLNEIKIKDFGKLIITDNDSEICDILKIANIILKRNLFNNNEPKEYSIIIYYTDSNDKWKERFFTTTCLYEFEFIYSNITEHGLEYRGNFKIDKSNDLTEWNLFKCNIKANNEYTGPICMNLDNNEYSLDIHNDKDVSVNDGLLKFNDNNAKISVIRDLKNKFDKENERNESKEDKS